MTIRQTKIVLIGIIILLSLLIFMQSCKKAETPDFSGSIALKANEMNVFALAGKTIQVTASEFYESRCPKNAMCVWEGYAAVKINFKDEKGEQNQLLCTGSCNIPTLNKEKTIELNGISYTIRLEDITPYPDVNAPESKPRTAIISVSR